MKALILAGGKGTRLSPITKDAIPKPMACLLGMPLLERAILTLKENGISEFFISVGHLHEKIEEYFGNGEKLGVKIEYIVEDEPLGSGGALYFLKGRLDETLLVLSGDLLFDVCIEKMLAFHKSKNASITLLTHPNAHPFDSDLVVCDSNSKVERFDLKGTTRNYYYKNLVNAGFIMIEPKTLEFFTEKKKINLEKDFVSHFIPYGEVYSYSSTEYVKDVGTPERFLQGEKDLKNNLPRIRNLKNKQKAVFIDRDGVINIYRGFVKSADDIELFETVPTAFKLLNSSEYLAIIISNQPVIARGECTFLEMEKMFDKIQTLLGKEGAFFNGYYYCPHHPDSGFEGEVKELKFNCDCRKPKTGMIDKAVKDFNIDLPSCFMVGDREVDIQTGINANIRTIKVESEKLDAMKVEPTYYCKDLLEAVQKILEKN